MMPVQQPRRRHPIPQPPKKSMSPVLIVVGALVLGGAGAFAAWFFGSGGKISVDSPLKVETPPKAEDFKLTTDMIRSRLRLILQRGDGPQRKDAKFPNNLTPESRTKWEKWVVDGNERYTAIEREPALKADREWNKWSDGPGKDMPDSVRGERLDEIFAPCFAAIIADIERVEGVR